MLGSVLLCVLGLALVLPLRALVVQPRPMPPFATGRQEPTSDSSEDDTPTPAFPIGILPADRIVGGSPTWKNQEPWQAFAFDGTYFCGGSVISPNYVITAGHCCTTNTGAVQSPSAYTVGLGEGSLVNGLPAGGWTYTVSQVIRHPSYKISAGGYVNNDLCLLRLSTTITYSSAVIPVALPTSSGRCAAGTNAVTSGWGLNSSTATTISSNLLFTNCVIEPCSTYSVIPASEINPSIMCVGDGPGITNYKSVGSGDSGGPLVNWYGTQVYLCGVTSFGYKPFGSTNYYPSGFANVFNALSWITSTVGSGYILV